jgi:thiol-disulfide isomerase/thioredoxin
MNAGMGTPAWQRQRRLALQAGGAALGSSALFSSTLGAGAWAASEGSTSNNASTATIVKGQRLDVPPMDLLSGGRFEPAQAEGRALVLYWWASWCPFCALQSPNIQALWQAEQARGLRLVGLSVDRTADEALRYWRAKGYSFPIAWVTPALARALPKPRGLPVVAVRAVDGVVATIIPGQMFPEDVQELARYIQ